MPLVLALVMVLVLALAVALALALELVLVLPPAGVGAVVVVVTAVVVGGACRMVPVSSMAESAPVRRSSRSTSWPADKHGGAGVVLALIAGERRQLVGGGM